MLVEVFRSFDLVEAICAKSFLDSRGVYSFIQNEHHITQSGGLLGVALGGYRILAAHSDAAEARRWLAEARAGEDRLDVDFDENEISPTRERDAGE